MSAITKDMHISDVISEYPETWTIFAKRGMGCCGCMGAIDESIENGARMHGIDVDNLLAELNQAARSNMLQDCV